MSHLQKTDQYTFDKGSLNLTISIRLPNMDPALGQRIDFAGLLSTCQTRGIDAMSF